MSNEQNNYAPVVDSENLPDITSPPADAGLRDSFSTELRYPYVAEGSWDVVYELRPATLRCLAHQRRSGVKVEGELSLQIDELELAGSRMSWSANATNPLEPAGSVQRLNFNGTVNGNRFAGTLYTQSGNLTVTGTRQ